MEDKLKLLNLAEEFKIEISKCGDNTFYIVSLKEAYGDDYEDNYYSLKCELGFNDKNHLISKDFYVTGAYNSGVDSLLINMDALNRLGQFIKLLSGEE